MSNPNPPVLSILMPVYNEAATISSAMDRALKTALPVSVELIVIDDGSDDGTSEILAEAQGDRRVRVVEHPANRGKGAALRTGLANASGQIAAVLDADLELDPRDLAPMLTMLLDDRGDLIIGARPLDRSTGQSVLYRLGNRGVTWMASRILGRRIEDLMTGQKMMRTEFFRSLELKENGFAVEAEIVAMAIRKGGRIVHVPVAYEPRSSLDGKKLRTVDGLDVARTLLRCRLGW